MFWRSETKAQYTTAFSPVKQPLLPPKLAWQLQVFLQQQLYRPKNDNAMLQKTREYHQCNLREFFGAASHLQKVALFTDLTVNEGRFLKLRGFGVRSGIISMEADCYSSGLRDGYQSAKVQDPTPTPLWTVNQMNNLPQYRPQ